jgi:hypothetical protein
MLCSLIVVLPWHYPGGKEENHETFQWVYMQERYCYANLLAQYTAVA